MVRIYISAAMAYPTIVSDVEQRRENARDENLETMGNVGVLFKPPAGTYEIARLARSRCVIP